MGLTVLGYLLSVFEDNILFVHKDRIWSVLGLECFFLLVKYQSNEENRKNRIAIWSRFAKL